MNKKIEIKFKLLSPLSHFSDERMGTMQISRTNKYRVGDKFVDVPVYSGNGFRGKFRRIAMRDFLERIGANEEGVSQKLYHTLFTGGSLVGGTRYEEMETYEIMKKMCPPLSLLGSAVGDKILQGKMKSSIFLPIAKETSEYTGVKTDISIYEMLEDVFYTRKDDLKSNEIVKVNRTKKEKDDTPTQMKYEIQGLSAGTELVGDVMIERANEIEESLFNATMKKFKEVPYIGGMSAAGHGKVEIKYTDLASEDIYYNYLEENKEDILNWLRELEEALK